MKKDCGYTWDNPFCDCLCHVQGDAHSDYVCTHCYGEIKESLTPTQTKDTWIKEFDKKFNGDFWVVSNDLGEEGNSSVDRDMLIDFIRLEKLKSYEEGRKENIWELASEVCDSFDILGIHGCSAGHCNHCGKCDALSEILQGKDK